MADIINVASSAYNMAGERSGRPDYLKSQIIGNIMMPNDSAIGPTIVKSYGTSSALRIRRFLRWVQRDSDFQEHIGVTSGTLPGGEELYNSTNQAIIQEHIWTEAGYTIASLLNTVISRGEVSYWVLRHMTRWYWGQLYTYTYDFSMNVVTVTLLADNSTFTFSPVDYDPDELYLYVRYVTTDDHVFWSIYHKGTGSLDLDALFDLVTPELIGSFYPPIPFRFENNPVSEDSPNPALAAIYPTCRDAFKRAFGVSFDDVQEKIMDNPSIADIDYVYAVLAVAFNTNENSGKKYIYRFFEYLRTHANNHTADGEARWLADWESGRSRPSPPWKSIRVEAKRSGESNYRTDIKWAFLHENTGTGIPVVGMRRGDYRITYMGTALSPVYTENDGFNQKVALWWQETENTWRCLVITGLQYNNYVYVTQHTRVTAAQAILITDKDCDFLVPLHDVLYHDLPLVDAIQIGTSCSFLVFNCYVEDKEEWYESDWFKILVVVVIIAVSIVAAILTGGASLGVGGAAVAGLLTGTGLSAAAALILAAAVEALAGLLISFLISEVAIALFGEEWGPLIGAIVSFIFTFGMSVGSISEILTALTKPDVWIALGAATAGGVASYMQTQAVQIAENTAKLMEEYSEKNAEVQRMYNDLQSGGRGDIDPSIVNRYIMETSEKPSDFFKRTLATGSDIVDITLKQIENFAQINLQRTLP
jgi:hypothetical protein